MTNAVKYIVKDGKTYAIENGGEPEELGPEVKVVAFAQTAGSNLQNIACLRIRTVDDEIVYHYVARSTLNKTGLACDFLVDHGYGLPADAVQRKKIIRSLNVARPVGRRLIAHVTGWHEGRFVLPGAIIGQSKKDNPKVVYIPDIVEKTKFGMSGELSKWKTKVAEPASNAPVMVLGIAAALAAPLLDLCGQEGGGFHLVGPSSKGKTVSLLVARSVSGDATRSDLPTWSTTVNAIEGVAFAYNHSLVCIDDTDQADGSPAVQAKMMRRVALQIANGSGKHRLAASSRGVMAAPTLQWKTLLMSSGVESLSQIVTRSGTMRLDSEHVRLCDLPAVIRDTTGVFAKLPKDRATLDAALGDLEEACREQHGTALRTFIRCVVEHSQETRERVPKLMAEFLNSTLTSQHDAWEQRFAKKFGLAYAAAVLGIGFGVLPWTDAQALQSIRLCYHRARDAVPNATAIASQAYRKLVGITKDSSRVIRLLGLNKADRAKVAPTQDQGFLDSNPKHGVHLVVQREVFRRWFASDSEVQLLLQKLDRDHRLIRERPSTATCQRKYPWDLMRHRYYFIRATKPRQANSGWL